MLYVNSGDDTGQENTAVRSVFARQLTGEGVRRHMPDRTTVREPERGDAEGLDLLRHHGISRRGVMKLLGAGAAVSALGGTAAGQNGQNARIDEVFGAPYAAEESPPQGLIDHEVTLRGSPADDGGSGSMDGSGESQGTDSQPFGVHEQFPLTPGEGGLTEEAEFFFDPAGLHVKPGDVVHFAVKEDHEHTVTAFADKYAFLPTHIPGDAVGFTSPPIVGDESWLYRFDASGVYDIACLPHARFGMIARVVVSDPKQGDAEALEDYGPIEGPPEGPNPFRNANLVLTAPELNPTNVVEQGEVAWADLTLEQSQQDG